MDARVTKKLMMVNAVSVPNQKQRSILYFKDEQGNCYEYTFSGSLTEKTRSRFFKNAKPHEYLPVLDRKNSKPWINISFRPGKTSYSPLVKGYVQEISYPTFYGAEEPKEENRQPHVFKKYYNQ